TSNFIFEIIAYAKGVFEIHDLNDLTKYTNNQALNINYETNALKAKLVEVKVKFNDEAIKKSGEDKHFINFTEPDNPSVIDKLRVKLITDKVTNEGNL